MLTSLKKQSQFDLINKVGRKSNNNYFIIIGAKNLFFKEDVDNIQFGIKVSKKFSKKAVVRNFVKRRIKHLIRLYCLKNNFAIIIIPKKGFEKAPFDILKQYFENCLQKIIV